MHYLPKSWRLWLIVALVPFVALAAFVLIPSSDGPGVNRTNFEKITKGMTHDEVRRILDPAFPFVIIGSLHSHTELWENVFDRDGTTISVYYELSKDENGINGIHLSMIVKDVSFQEPPFWERIWKSIRVQLP